MDLYCKIFIDTLSEYNIFFENVRNFVGGHKTALSGIVSEWCDMDIRKNKEYISGNPDFLYWKFFIDIEPAENISGDKYINNLKNFVCLLKQNYNVICACDFEELL